MSLNGGWLRDTTRVGKEEGNSKGTKTVKGGVTSPMRRWVKKMMWRTRRGKEVRGKGNRGGVEKGSGRNLGGSGMELSVKSGI